MNGNGVIDDKHNIYIEDAIIHEGDSKTLTITRSSREPISVKVWSTSVGSGYNIQPLEASGGDFIFANNSIIDFGSSTSRTFEVQAVDYSISEWNESFQIGVTVQTPSSSPVHYVKRYSTITIIDNDYRTQSSDQVTSSDSTSAESSTAKYDYNRDWLWRNDKLYIIRNTSTTTTGDWLWRNDKLYIIKHKYDYNRDWLWRNDKLYIIKHKYHCNRERLRSDEQFFFND